LVFRFRPRDGVSRVAPILVVCVPSSLPRWSCWVPVALFPSSGSFPCAIARSASTSLFFEACSTFTHITARTLAESLNDPFHRRLQTARCLPACSDCYRPERPLPGGTCTLSRIVPFHGTRLLRRKGSSMTLPIPKHTFAPRGAMRPGCCQNRTPRENRGRGECRMPSGTRSLACRKRPSRTRVFTARHRKTPGIPARNGFTAYTRSPRR